MNRPGFKIENDEISNSTFTVYIDEAASGIEVYVDENHADQYYK